MSMPFSIDQFFDVFRRYNEAVWPSQWILVALALVAAAIAADSRERFRTVPVTLLAALWIWMGVVYHALFFSAINPAAIGFAAMFLLQGAMLAWFGVVQRRIVFSPPRGIAGAVGALLMTYALIVYPLSGWMIGHRYPAAPTFGLPCPTTIFTFGLLLWAKPPFSRSVLIIPTLWSFIGTMAAMQMGMVEDLALLPAALIGIGFSFRGARRMRSRGPAVGMQALER